MNFALDPVLAADSIELGDFALSRALLMNDARYEWLILAPRRAEITEIFELAREERATLIEEVSRTAAVLGARPGVDKVNVGALGNIVRQLHVHIVARRQGDAAWPGPVWGVGAARRYEEGEAQRLVDELREALGL